MKSKSMKVFDEFIKYQTPDFSYRKGGLCDIFDDCNLCKIKGFCDSVMGYSTCPQLSEEEVKKIKMTYPEMFV